jgi:hypothetical protein
VAPCDSPVPVRLDHRVRTLDLMMIRWFILARTPSLSDPIWITGSRSDGWDQKGEGYLLGLGLRRAITGEHVQGPSSGDAPVGSSAGEDADGGQCDSASSGVWSTHSIASWTCAERRSEQRWCRCASGSRWLARSKRKLSRKNISGGVPKQRKKLGGRRGALEYRSLSELSIGGGGVCRSSMRNSSDW